MSSERKSTLAEAPHPPEYAAPPRPRPNRRLTALAADVVRNSRPLLPPRARLFLGIEIDTAGELQLLWWRDDFRIAARLAATQEGFCPIGSEEGALQHASVALLDYLAGRWPAPPERVGVVTDGQGLAFSADDPAPSGPGWLLRHAAGSAMLCSILPLDPAGPCGLFRSDAATSIH